MKIRCVNFQIVGQINNNFAKSIYRCIHNDCINIFPVHEAATINVVPIVPQPSWHRIPRSQRSRRPLGHLGSQTVTGWKSRPERASTQKLPTGLRTDEPHGHLWQKEAHHRPWRFPASANGFSNSHGPALCSNARLFALRRSLSSRITDSTARRIT